MVSGAEGADLIATALEGGGAGAQGAAVAEEGGANQQGGAYETVFIDAAGDADSVIEDKIRVSTAPKRLTVVSSDRKVQAAARTRKATVVKSEVFWNSVGKQLGKVKTTKEPGGKRWGISESETEHWLKFFGLEQ